MVSKLSNEQVSEVIDRYENGEGGSSISKDYPVTPRAIYGLLDRQGIERRSIGETLKEDVEEQYCKNCNEKIPRRKKENPKRYEKRVFCSPECHRDWRKENSEYDTRRGDKKTCEYCGDVFYSFREEAMYCSRRCAYDDRDGKSEIECDNCGKCFVETDYKVEHNEHNFCSSECSRDYFRGENHYNWKGGRNKYRGEYWNEVRKEILNRDNFECQNCGVEENLQVHHKIPFDEFESSEEANELSNLVTLCLSCHMKAERHYQSKGEVLYD